MEIRSWYGSGLISAIVVTKKVIGNSKEYGFVEMLNDEEGETAIIALNATELFLN